jgi:pimeloyl-ACP methyl ester carboxylesterase
MVIAAIMAATLAACQAAPAGAIATSPAPGSADVASPTASVLAETSPGPTASAIPSVSPSGVAVAGSFDVGGHSLYLECLGSGSPTIVFLHGIGGDRSHGYPLRDAFSKRTRVCTYDRANMGSSEVAGVLTGTEAAADLANLLAAAHIEPPYLLVAGSFGGLVGLTHAGAHPTDVAGIVFIDASLPSDADIDAMLAQRGLVPSSQPSDPYANGGEVFRYSIHQEARAALATLPRVPMSYLRALQFDAPPGAPRELMVSMGKKGIEEVLAHSSSPNEVDVNGPHNPFLQPPINVEVTRILDLLGTP